MWFQLEEIGMNIRLMADLLTSAWHTFESWADSILAKHMVGRAAITPPIMTR